MMLATFHMRRPDLRDSTLILFGLLAAGYVKLTPATDAMRQLLHCPAAVAVVDLALEVCGVPATDRRSPTSAASFTRGMS